MKKLILPALVVALALPALPGAAQLPVPSSSASATPTPTATASATPTATSTDGTPVQIYAGRAGTRGLTIAGGGMGLNFGLTQTSVASSSTDGCAGVACAAAAGVGEPLGTTTTATSPGEGNPEPVEAFNLDPASQAVAGQGGAAEADTTTQPSAGGVTDAITLELTLTQTLLSQFPAEVTDGLNSGIAQLTDALSPLTENDPTGVLSGVTDQLNSLLDDLASGPLLTIQGGQTESSTSFDDGVVTSTSAAQGVIITLLPTPESVPLAPEGVAVIEIGSSTASASADGTNPATADATGSVARITLLPGILDAVPDLDLGELDGLPLDEILDLLPPEITDLLPGELTDLLGLGDGASEEPTADPTSTESEGGPTGTPIDDLLPTGVFMQADEDSGGFVIDLETGTEQMCFLEGTPLHSCVTLGGTSETFSDDNLGVGVLAAGADLQLGIDDTGTPMFELAVARSEAGAAAEFQQVAQPTPTPTPTPQTGMPRTGGGSGMAIPALGLIGISLVSLFGLRRRRI